MATISTINIGNIVNDGLGDDLRTAFQKVNANFTELNAALTVTASNLGPVGESVFKQKTGVNLEFRKLVAGNKITITSNPESIVIASTVGNSFNRITTQSGFINSDDHQFITLQGDNDITVSAVNDVITIATNLDLNQILKVLDFGPIGTPNYVSLNNLWNNTMQVAMAASNIDFGTFTNPGTINYDLGLFA